MVADKKEGHRVFMPLEQRPDGQVRAELPKVVAKLFEAKARGNLAYIHGQHERVDLPLDRDFFMGVKAL